MNKTIQQMHKVMTARLMMVLLIIVTFSSCKKELNEDRDVLYSILESRNYSEQDSVYIEENSDNKRIKTFFKDRRTIEETFKYANKDGSPVKKTDSSYLIYDTIIRKPMPLKRDAYLLRGKVINKKAEAFLKDSFNYNFSALKWDIKKPLYNVNPEDTTIAKSNLKVSKPVFNVSKTKAIVITTKGFSYYLENIYLLEKVDNDWEIIFQQERN